jgi:hypothetical protein
VNPTYIFTNVGENMPYNVFFNIIVRASLKTNTTINATERQNIFAYNSKTKLGRPSYCAGKSWSEC